MHTDAAARAHRARHLHLVARIEDLLREGWTRSAIRAQLAAGRWQRAGRAVVLHNGPLTTTQARDVVLINAGPRSVLTSFTALEAWGLTGWERSTVHVLVPRGARLTTGHGIDHRVHFTDRWHSRDVAVLRALHRPAQAAALSAASFSRARPACGVLAAVVQQRLARPVDIVAAVEESTRQRHRAVLLAAAHDITQGAHALSEIDFARLCRRHRLPPPHRQRVRVEPDGRRRYLDAEWELRGARRLVVEVDGALHLAAPRWWDDQLRQNELVLTGDPVLRFPSALIRCDPNLVIDQLRRGLLL